MEHYVCIAVGLGRDRRAVTLVEYAVIAGIIAATIAVGFTSLADALSTQFVALSGRL
jgi:Flp pilus assembly pilin Flp